MKSQLAKIALPGIVLVVASGCSDEAQQVVSFSKDVQPVLVEYCQECHQEGGSGDQASGFLVGTYGQVMAGTKLGPMVVPHDALSSNLYRLVAGEVHPSITMPHGKEKLTATDIAKIEQWIQQGAKDN